MNIRLLENGDLIQRAFIEKFTLTYNQFILKHQAKTKVETYIKEDSDMDAVLIWDKLNTDFAQISFHEALKSLQDIDGEVLLMPDPSKTSGDYLAIDGIKRKDCVAAANAKALAELIEYEWYENWKAFSQERWLDNTILPDDLYVFDENMERVVIFTHEYDFWELETTDEYMKCADSRFCLAYGLRY